MSTQHTPGPWDIEQDEPADWEFGEAHHYRVMDEGGCTVARCYQQPHDTWTAKANARLIAAAPDLLEAAEAMVTKYDSGAFDSFDAFLDSFDALRAAIAKAKGCTSTDSTDHQGDTCPVHECCANGACTMNLTGATDD